MISSVVYVFFWKKLDKYSDIFIATPFVLLMSYLIFTSGNLISFIFYVEIALLLKEIVFKINVERYETYHFKLTRLPLWVFSLYCYFMTFGTFSFVKIVEKTDIKLSMLYVSFLLILVSMTLGFLYRKKYPTKSKIEAITLFSILIPAISFKMFSLLSNWGDLLLPAHREYINILVGIVAVITFVVSLRYLYTEKKNDLAIGFSLVILSTLYPLLIYINPVFWSEFVEYSLRIIILLVIFHVFYLNNLSGRPYKLLMFALLCELSGIGPNGHIYQYFGGYVEGSDQVSSIILLIFVIFGVAAVAKSIIKSMKPVI
jgi:hypothetical protein